MWGGAHLGGKCAQSDEAAGRAEELHEREGELVGGRRVEAADRARVVVDARSRDVGGQQRQHDNNHVRPVHGRQVVPVRCKRSDVRTGARVYGRAASPLWPSRRALEWEGFEVVSPLFRPDDGHASE